MVVLTESLHNEGVATQNYCERLEIHGVGRQKQVECDVLRASTVQPDLPDLAIGVLKFKSSVCERKLPDQQAKLFRNSGEQWAVILGKYGHWINVPCKWLPASSR